MNEYYTATPQDHPETRSSTTLPLSATAAFGRIKERGPFLCNFKGCRAKPFKRRAELQRHELGHNPSHRPFPCTALGCDRTGHRAFARLDKLKDHVLAGHDDHTLFKCFEKNQGISCSIILTRDIMALHACDSGPQLNRYRACPMPRCPFRFFLAYRQDGAEAMDKLQSHLLEKHDQKGRANCAAFIQARGYDSVTGDIVCPVYSKPARFGNHIDFYHHFMVVHFHREMPISSSELEKTFSGNFTLFYYDLLNQCSHVPDKIRQARRILLSLWPAFEYYPVWEDIVPWQVCLSTGYGACI